MRGSRTHSSLRNLVRRALARQALVGPADRVAIAISGGADSVALALLLRDVLPDLDAQVAGLLHLNHQLRGAASDADEAFCRALALREGWRIEVARVDVAALARREHRSLEATARAARYRFFAAAAERLNATRIATGHTQDDQAETVLLRLLRGSGLRGISGIRARRGVIIRPLLGARRADLRQELIRLEEPHQEDASNADTSIPRNRLRHELLPVIERLAPRAVPALARFASLAAEDDAVLGEAAEAALAAVAVGPSGSAARDGSAGAGQRAITLDAQALGYLPTAIARRVVRLAIDRLDPVAPWSLRHVAAVLRLSRATGPTGHLDLPGVTAERRHGQLTLRRATAADPDLAPQPAGEAGPYTYPLLVPGSVTIAEAGLTISARWATGSDRVPAQSDGWTQVLPGTGLALPLSVRNRRPGDRLQPFGAPGRRKLQDLLVDRKTPRHLRDRLPLVVDAHNQILWVVGLAAAEAARVTAAGGDMVVLEAKRS